MTCFESWDVVSETWRVCAVVRCGRRSFGSRHGVKSKE